MKLVKCAVKVLLIVGALNWGLVGFFGYNPVADLFGGMMTTGARVVFGLVGLAGLFALARLFGCCRSGCGCGCTKCGPGCDCHKK
jgi:hypothetical protein